MMKNVWIGVGISALVLIGGYTYYASQSEIVYVKAVADEVTALEDALKEVEHSVSSGTMTPEEAVVVQKNIVARIKAIETAAKKVDATGLSAEDKKRLADGLSRLTQILITYRDTLVTIDIKAEDDADASSKDSISGSTIIESVLAVADAVADVAEDITIDLSDLDTVSEELEEETEVPSDETVNVDGEGTETTEDTDFGNEGSVEGEGNLVEGETSGDTEDVTETVVEGETNDVQSVDEDTETEVR